MAKTRIGQLNALLTLNSSQFQKGVRGATKSTKRMSRGVSSARRTIAGLGASLSAVFGARALMRGFGAAVNNFDSIAKTSKKLGIAPRELFKLREAAKLSGIGVNTLDMALQRMVRRVSEAGAGTGEAVKAIDELGLHAKSLAALAPEKQFLVIMKALEGVANQGDKVRLLFKFFDSEGVSIGQMSAREIARAQTMMEKFGITLDLNVLRVAEALNDGVNDLKMSFTRLSEVVIAKFGPRMVKMLAAIANSIAGLSGQDFMKMAAWAKVALGVMGVTLAVKSLVLVSTALKAVWTGILFTMAAVKTLQAGWRVAAAGVGVGLAVLIDRAIHGPYPEGMVKHNVNAAVMKLSSLIPMPSLPDAANTAQPSTASEFSEANQQAVNDLNQEMVRLLGVIANNSAVQE